MWFRQSSGFHTARLEMERKPDCLNQGVVVYKWRMILCVILVEVSSIKEEA